MSVRYIVEFYDGRYRVTDTQDDGRVVAWSYFRPTAIATVDALNKAARENADDAA